MRLSATFAILGLALAGAVPAIAQQPAGSAAPLPTASQPPGGQITSITVPSGTRALFKIACPAIAGDGETSKTVVETEARDFTLSSLFQVLDPQSFTANLAAEGSSIDPASWRNVGAEGVVKGTSAMRGSQLHVELKLFVVSRGADAVLSKSYDVAQGSVRSAVHQFDNEVVKWFTGTPGSFGTRLVFSATVGRGQKGIFSIDSDGQGLGRLQTTTNVALAPAIGPGGGVYYAGGMADGSYGLFRVGSPAPVMHAAGLVFGVAFGGGKMALVVSNNGQSDIFVGAPDGSGLQKVTAGGLNTHPAFGPSGQLAYVSNQGGNPQIYVDGKPISPDGLFASSPTFCNNPNGVRAVFGVGAGKNADLVSTGESGGGLSRLTQGQGSNSYPACSPDGRLVAFFSTRGGLFSSNADGLNQNKLASVTGESLRWE